MEFVLILTLRYMEPNLIWLAHDWVESQEALDARLTMIKEFQNVLAEKFQARAETQKGVTSPNLQFGD